MFGRDVVIAGIHATEQGAHLDHRTSADLIVEAVRGALADACIDRHEVDGAAVEWPGPGGGRFDGATWARLLGTPMRWVSGDGMDASGIRGITKAAAAIASGCCDVAIVGGGRAGPWSLDGRAVGSELGHEFSDTWGAFVPAHFAFVAQRHMHVFGTTSEQLATVAATIRNHGHANPEAVMFGRGPYTADDVLASRLIASPFHLLDLCLVAEGGAAVVLTTAERARDLPKPAISLLGLATEARGVSYANPARLEEVRELGRSVAARAFGEAGVAPMDVDVFSLYDPNSFEILHQLELLGLCADGEGAALVGDGRAIGPDGAHPVNLDGGTLSYSWNGHQQMTLKIIDCVRQLRGEAAVHQLASPEVAVATNAGSAAQHYEMAVLGRSR